MSRPNEAHLAADLRRYGPSSPAAYTDSQGHPRVGRASRLDQPESRDRLAAVGADLDALLAGTAELTGEQVDTLFEADLARAVGAARSALPDFDAMPSLAQLVSVSLLFDLGSEAIDAARSAAASTGCDAGGLAIDGSTATRWYDQPPAPA